MTTHAETLRFQVEDADALMTRLLNVADELAEAIEVETLAKSRLRDAEEMLKGAESEAIYSAQMEANVAKAGPLAGIATTSKAYPAALDVLVAGVRQNGLSHMVSEVSRLRIAAEDALIRREQVAVRFSSCKHASDLKAAVLKALSSIA